VRWAAGSGIRLAGMREIRALWRAAVS
jgi:hypothetical protein